MADRPVIHCDTICPTLRVPDVRAAAQYYRDKLGFEIDFLWGEPPVHAGVRLGCAPIHFSKGDPDPCGMWIALAVDHIDPLFEWYKSNGVELLDEPESKPWGMREFNIRDPNGYHLRFGQHDFRSGPPVPIERVDVQVRMERRLASLMMELAEHKGMTIGEMLEETLLHTFEPMPDCQGQGVASPHTRQTLAVIDQLKRKHGIDYDTHASYRFIEE
jgi:catechol 2,3-dioxygenase-like lactoylglutathione lyase family enzyme